MEVSHFKRQVQHVQWEGQQSRKSRSLAENEHGRKIVKYWGASKTPKLHTRIYNGNVFSEGLSLTF